MKFKLKMPTEYKALQINLYKALQINLYKALQIHLISISLKISIPYKDHIFGYCLVITLTNSSQLMTPSLSLSAQSTIWSTSAADKFYPTLWATFQNYSGPKAPCLLMSKYSNSWPMEDSLDPSPLNPKTQRKPPKSISSALDDA